MVFPRFALVRAGCLAWVLVFACSYAVPLSAQSVITSAALTGRIVDATGAAMPDVLVCATNVERAQM